MLSPEKVMRKAIFLARKGKGLTPPNPCVGAVVLKEGEIIGEGWHRGYGLDHAEVDAIKDALAKGFDVKGADLFVTLEPCNHYGKTPPCTEFIIQHGIRRVFVGCEDPNPEVRGGGIGYLRSKGIEVVMGVLEDRCRELIDDFVVWIKKKRPYVYLKLASTLDGCIADSFGNSRWVSSDSSRTYVQKLRSFVDAILIGSNTLYKDDPRLTCRVKRIKDRQPFAVIVSRSVPCFNDFCGLYVFKNRLKETLFFTNKSRENMLKLKPWQERGLKVHFVSLKENGLLSLREVFEVLYCRYNCYYVLCEGGGRLALSLVEERVVDELVLFFASKILGDSAGIKNFSGRHSVKLRDAINFSLKKVKRFGDDVCLFLTPNSSDQ